jgi:hypothetical protein
LAEQISVEKENYNKAYQSKKTRVNFVRMFVVLGSLVVALAVSPWLMTFTVLIGVIFGRSPDDDGEWIQPA